MYVYIAHIVLLYLVCEWTKRSPFVHYYNRKSTYYDNCIKVLEPHISKVDSVYHICDDLNHRENFSTFVHTLLLTVVAMYALVRNIVAIETVGPLYWGIAHASVVIYAITGNYPLFQFSYTAATHYTLSTIAVTASFLLPLSCLAARQVYRGEVRGHLLRFPLAMYFISFFLFATGAGILQVAYHIHHAIFAGIASLLFTNMSDPVTRYTHAVLVGIVVEGLNYYTVEDVHLFHIPHTDPPGFTYMSWIVVPGLFIAFGPPLVRWVDKVVRRRGDDVPSPPSSFEIPLLVPTEREMNQVL